MVYEFLPPSVWLSLQFWLAGQLSSGIYTAGGAFELYGCCGTTSYILQVAVLALFAQLDSGLLCSLEVSVNL